MVSLYRDPAGEGIFIDLDPSRHTEKSEIRNNHNDLAVNLTDLSDSEKVVLLNSQVARLKETLTDKKRRIVELETVIKSFISEGVDMH